MIQYSKVVELMDSDPVTLTEAKTHLEVTGTSKDTYITMLISVARRLCESYSGLSLCTQQRKIILDYFHECDILIPYGPIQSIDSFTYVDTDGATQTLVEGTDFYLDSHSDIARVIPIADGEVDSWPDTLNRINAVTIEYTAGYDDVSGTPTPEQIKQAMLLQIGAMFENRQDEIIGSTSHKLNMNSQMLLDTVKVSWNAHY